MIRAAAARLPSATILAFVHFCKRFLLLPKWARVPLLQFTGGHTLRRILGAVRQGLHPGSALHRLDCYEPPLQERLHNIGAGFAYCTSRGSLQAETLISRTLESARALVQGKPPECHCIPPQGNVPRESIQLSGGVVCLAPPEC